MRKAGTSSCQRLGIDVIEPSPFMEQSCANSAKFERAVATPAGAEKVNQQGKNTERKAIWREIKVGDV